MVSFQLSRDCLAWSASEKEVKALRQFGSMRRHHPHSGSGLNWDLASPAVPLGRELLFEDKANRLNFRNLGRVPSSEPLLRAGCAVSAPYHEKKHDCKANLLKYRLIFPKPMILQSRLFRTSDCSWLFLSVQRIASQAGSLSHLRRGSRNGPGPKFDLLPIEKLFYMIRLYAKSFCDSESSASNRSGWLRLQLVKFGR
jgi:hypothetical protein